MPAALCMQTDIPLSSFSTTQCLPLPRLLKKGPCPKCKKQNKKKQHFACRAEAAAVVTGDPWQPELIGKLIF